MIIISPSSVVTLFVDARKLKDLHGGCTLGVQSILSAKPAKRFATIVAMNACVVQKLTRKDQGHPQDWLDTLKSHAEHRFWIGDFVKEQLQVANEQAQETIRKYRWQKIKEREGAAMKLHRERTLSRYRPKPPSPSSVQPEGGPAVNLVEEEEDEVERWPCFNGQEAVVPHTRLPTLVPCIEAREDEDGIGTGNKRDVAKSLRFTRGSGQRRSVLGELPQLDNMPTISHNSWLDAQASKLQAEEAMKNTRGQSLELPFELIRAAIDQERPMCCNDDAPTNTGAAPARVRRSVERSGGSDSLWNPRFCPCQARDLRCAVAAEAQPQTFREVPDPVDTRRDGLSAGSERPVGGQRPTERPSEEDQRVSVCVRVRPMSEAEVSDGFTQVINCDLDHPGTIQVLRPCLSRKQETYTFDTVLPSSAGQAAVYNLIGSPIFDRLADGYNSCIIAFGATGCGKSHTIFGLNPKQEQLAPYGGQLFALERGLVPRISESLFKAFSNVGKQTLVKVSYLELYNEKARDLLKPDGVENGQAASLEAGVFVEGLTRSAVSSSEDVLRLVDFGHKIRVVRSTHMNAHSSRSHAIVTLHLQQALNEPGSRQIMRHSQLHAVDLAGAERLFMVGEDTLRRRESMQINKSLLALGQMISKLSKGMAGSFVPYRNSKLTFLLADSLMGNCQTAMIACISPSSSYQQLTESTLRFATSVKEIKTKPVQNEEPTGDLVQALRAEVAMLRRRLRQGSYDQSQAREMEAQLRGDEYLQEGALMEELSANIAEMQARAKTAEGLRRRTLRQLGLRKSEAKNGIFLQKISSDPLLSGCLTWTMSPGDELRIGSDPDCEILVDGLGVEATMCHLHCLDASTIQVLPGDAKQLSEDEDGRDGLHRRCESKNLGEPQVLQSGDFLRVGRTHFFRAVGTDALSADRAEDARVMDAAIGIDVAKDAQHLRDRFGVEKADEVIRDLKELKLVVEEANELTVELRGLDEVSFKGRLLMDPLESEEKKRRPRLEPSVVVSKIERPEGSEERTHRSQEMIICCIWGLVAYFADQSAAIGIVLSALYGLVLFLCVDRWLSPQMAGMLWPNIPVAVGAVGALVATYLPDNDESKLPSRALIFCILPATLATIYWMRRLPEDPDRSTLVSNLFLGLWAATIALRAMLVDDDSLKDLGYFDFASLVVLGAISVGVAVWFFERPGRWGSVDADLKEGSLLLLNGFEETSQVSLSQNRGILYYTHS
eukprot:g23481.t1